MFPSSILGAAAEILKFYKFLENVNDNKVLSFSSTTGAAVRHSRTIKNTESCRQSHHIHIETVTFVANKSPLKTSKIKALFMSLALMKKENKALFSSNWKLQP